LSRIIVLAYCSKTHFEKKQNEKHKELSIKDVCSQEVRGLTSAFKEGFL